MIRAVIRGRAGWAVTNSRRPGGCLTHNNPPPPPLMGNVFAVFAPPGQYLAELWLLHHVHLTDKCPPYHLATAPASCCLIRLICVTWGLVHETNASLHCHGTFSGSPHNALHSLVYWGEPERAPHLRGERRFCLFVYIYIYIYISVVRHAV